MLHNSSYGKTVTDTPICVSIYGQGLAKLIAQLNALASYLSDFAYKIIEYSIQELNLCVLCVYIHSIRAQFQNSICTTLFCYSLLRAFSPLCTR